MGLSNLLLSLGVDLGVVREDEDVLVGSGDGCLVLGLAEGIISIHQMQLWGVCLLDVLGKLSVTHDECWKLECSDWYMIWYYFEDGSKKER